LSTRFVNRAAANYTSLLSLFLFASDLSIYFTGLAWFRSICTQVHSRIHKKKIMRATEISTGVSMTAGPRRRREGAERGNDSPRFLSRFLADVVTPGTRREEEEKKNEREKRTIHACTINRAPRRVAIATI